MSLRARDLVSSGFLQVQTHCRIADYLGGPKAAQTPAFAVFADGTYVGLVDSGALVRFPHRIFADLCHQASIPAIPDSTPLTEVLAEMDRQGTNVLPVLGSDGCFIGIVTRPGIFDFLAKQTGIRFQGIRQLIRATEDLDAGLNLDEVLQKTIVLASQLAGARHGALGMILENQGQIARFFTTGIDDATKDAIGRPPESMALLGELLRAGKTLRMSDIGRHPKFSGFPPHHPVMRSFLGVPIRLRNRILGSLYVADKDEAEEFSEEDEALLEVLAAQSAVAIENARLHAEAERRRREAEAVAGALSDSESRYRGLVEGSIQGIYIHRDFVIEFANPAAALVFGYDSGAELVGQDLRARIAPHEIPRLEGYAAARLRGEHLPSRYEYQGIRKDGSLIWIDTLVSVIVWDGAPAFLATLFDITERKRAEEALRKSQEQLRQSQKVEAIGRLAGGIAHDFNNLLTVISGRSQLILNRLRPEDVLRRDIDLILKSGTRAATLTQQLLAFSRKQILQTKVLDLNAVVVGMEGMLRRLISEDIALGAVLEPSLWRITADGGQLEQVLLNLVVNARDAMRTGGDVTISTRNAILDADFVAQHPGARVGSYVMLAISDTGIGMDAATQARLFEPFFTTKAPGEGTGLGLSTVYGIVTQHDGFITVRSALGQGTTFTIFLPRAEADKVVASEAAPVPVNPQAGEETILLVEDDEGVRKIAREVLEANGYAVLEAPLPTDAIRMAEAHLGYIHLVLTDVVMPGMSGRELAEHLLRLHAEAKILFMSGYTDDAIVHHGVLDSGTALLFKPFSPESLTLRVREVLDEEGFGTI